MTCENCIHYEACLSVYMDLKGHNFPCPQFKDRSRFVELPHYLTDNLVIKDNPTDNYSTLLNFAFVKDRNVVLRYANGKENVDLCDYIAFHAQKDCKMTADEVRDGACFECGDDFCSLGIAYFSAVQAAELRERLKDYESLAKQVLKERENHAE